MDMTAVQDVYAAHLADLRSVETQLVDALAAMADAATDKKLKQALGEHGTQTEQQLERVEEIIRTSSFDVPEIDSQPMRALIGESRAIIESDGDDDVRDVALVGVAQRIEHYEIAAYGTARALAEQLDHRDARDVLGETLEEERRSDELLTKLATGGLIVAGLNEKAHG